MPFDAGAIVGRLEIESSQFAGAMYEARKLAGEVAGGLTETFKGFGNLLGGHYAHGLSELNKGLGELATVAVSVGVELGHLAVEGLEKVFENAEHVAHQMHAMGVAAEAAGVSVEFMSGVGKVAEASGSSVEGLSMAMKFLEKHAADAADGNKTAIKDFQDVGISAADLAGKLKDPQALFYAVADGIKAIEDPARRTQAALLLMSRAGADQIPFLSQGGEKIRELAEQVKALGGTFDEQDAEMGKSFGELNLFFDSAILGIEKAAAKPVLQFLQDHSKELLEDMKALAQWFEQHVPAALEVLMKAAQKAGSFLKTVFDYGQDLTDLVGLTDPNDRYHGYDKTPLQAPAPKEPANVNVDVTLVSPTPEQVGHHVGKKVTAHLQKQLTGAAHVAAVKKTLRGK